jgi:hypothetical protein
VAFEILPDRHGGWLASSSARGQRYTLPSHARPFPVLSIILYKKNRAVPWRQATLGSAPRSGGRRPTWSRRCPVRRRAGSALGRSMSFFEQTPLLPPCSNAFQPRCLRLPSAENRLPRRPERDPSHKKRLLTAAEGWLILAGV